MKPLTSPAELRHRGLEVLVRELGYVDAMRFLLQYETGQGDYTRDRRQFLPSWTVEELIREANRHATPRPPS